MYRGRLAPTPSGFLHLGHAQTFWVAYRRCRERSGHLLLRHDDLDRQRCKPEFVAAAEEDLKWLGLGWDEGPYFQSQRTALYDRHLERLQQLDLVYACTCSRKEIAQAQSAPNLGDEEPLYPGTCRNRPGPPVGEIRSWRFRVPEGESIDFEDLGQGDQSFVAGRDFADFVVWKPQEGPSYQLACVVDDALMEVSEVVRGCDLLLSSARQILLYRSFGYPVPNFYHCNLVMDEEGRRLAKRHDALALRTLRDDGVGPEEVLGRFFGTVS